MELEELQKLFEFLNPLHFKDPIPIGDQKKYDTAFEDLQKKVSIKNKFIIETESFQEVIFHSIENGAKYLKIHLIEETGNLGVNIGLSFCKEGVIENGTVDNDINFFCSLQNNRQFKKISRKKFTTCKEKFNETTLKKINQHTDKENTQYIKYEIDDVLRYTIRNLLSNTFNIRSIVINQFIFKDYDNINPLLNDRIGISVHSVLKKDAFIKEDVASIGYDFGNVYP